MATHHKVRRRTRQRVQYELVVHSNVRTRTINTKYVHLKNAVQGGSDRCLRGADWFEVWEIHPERRVAKGRWKDGQCIVQPEATTRSFILDNFPIHWRREPE